MVGRVLAAHFRTYLSAMERMAAPIAGAADVLGVAPDGAPPGGGGGGAAAQFGGSVMSAMSGAMGLFGRAQGRATSVSSRGRRGAEGSWGKGEEHCAAVGGHGCMPTPALPIAPCARSPSLLCRGSQHAPPLAISSPPLRALAGAHV